MASLESLSTSDYYFAPESYLTSQLYDIENELSETKPSGPPDQLVLEPEASGMEQSEQMAVEPISIMRVAMDHGVKDLPISAGDDPITLAAIFCSENGLDEDKGSLWVMTESNNI